MYIPITLKIINLLLLSIIKINKVTLHNRESSRYSTLNFIVCVFNLDLDNIYFPIINTFSIYSFGYKYIDIPINTSIHNLLLLNIINIVFLIVGIINLLYYTILYL